MVAVAADVAVDIVIVVEGVQVAVHGDVAVANYYVVYCHC